LLAPDEERPFGEKLSGKRKIDGKPRRLGKKRSTHRESKREKLSFILRRETSLTLRKRGKLASRNA